MSFGIAVYPSNGKLSQDLMAFADANLYQSKRHGGDTITLDDSSSEERPLKSGAFGVLDGLITAVDNKDHYTRKHSEDVTTYALALAESLGLSEETLRTVLIAGLLHDVGKIGIPDRILRKPGRLDEDEFAVVKQHAQLGEMIIQDVPNISDVLIAVGAHHERFDGGGYPRGLREDQIPLLGRILAVADTFSAMTTDRPYRKAMSPDEAVVELRRVAGSQLDPGLVELFLRLRRDLDASEAA
jgi:HD-GYP domain-containing protein (c-di-GMP phosphodiesterase class II)